MAKPEEVGAICVGGAGAPGIAEGTARIVKNEKEWDVLQPGEILVCITTYLDAGVKYGEGGSH